MPQMKHLKYLLQAPWANEQKYSRTAHEPDEQISKNIRHSTTSQMSKSRKKFDTLPRARTANIQKYSGLEWAQNLTHIPMVGDLFTKNIQDQNTFCDLLIRPKSIPEFFLRFAHRARERSLNFFYDLLLRPGPNPEPHLRPAPHARAPTPNLPKVNAHFEGISCA